MKNTIILLLCLLTGCASFFPSERQTHFPSLSWSSRQAQLQKVAHWHAEGMMSIRRPQQSAAFSFDWQQNQENYSLQFFAPLGLGSLRVVGDASHVVLWQSATQKIRAKTPEALMLRQLGYSVPVTCLYYWIRGLPDPRLPMTIVLDADHHLSELQQQGWNIRFQNFKTISGVDLPTSLLLANESMQVKIAITRWDLL